MSSLKLLHSGGNGVIISAPSSNPSANRTITLNDTYAGDGSFVTANSSGNVGIGTASPTGDLHIQSSNEYCLKINKSDSTAAYMQFYNSTTGSSTSDGFRLGMDSNEDALFSLRESGNMKFDTNNTERMRIDSSGRLLVNSTSTSIASKLISTIGTGTGVTWDQCGLAVTHVSGANTKSLIGFGFSGNGGSYPPAAIGSFTNSTSGNENNNLVFFTRSATSDTEATERMRITSSGSLLVGRTNNITTGGDQTDHTFEQIVSNQYAIGVHCGQQYQRGIAVYYTTGQNIADAFRLNVGSTTNFVVLGSGNVQNANNSYGSTSDVSLKENIVDSKSQWNDIKNIKVRNYNFKKSTGHDTKTQIGVVAQELETVCPKLVSTNEDGLKAVNYSVLYMKAIKALQEAMTEIETLKTKVAALEAA